MARRHRPHINPFSLRSLVARGPLPFPDPPQPIEIDLGCGDGEFILQRALKHRDRMFLGVDIRAEFLDPGLEKIKALKLPNIQLSVRNFLVELDELFPPGRIAAFYVNFPDPLFKRRQRRRRWFDGTTIDGLVRALIPGGKLFFQSDVWEPALDALAVMESNDHLLNAAGSFRFARAESWDLEKTSRELSCERQGRKIWRLAFERRALSQSLSADRSLKQVP